MFRVLAKKKKYSAFDMNWEISALCIKCTVNPPMSSVGSGGSGAKNFEKFTTVFGIRKTRA